MSLVLLVLVVVAVLASSGGQEFNAEYTGIYHCTMNGTPSRAVGPCAY